MKNNFLKGVALFLLSWLPLTVSAQSLVGVAAPVFQLADQNNVQRSLASFKGRWLVLYFYPKDHTPGCTTEAKNFARDYAQFQALNTEIAGISLDDAATHKSFAEATGSSFPLLADIDKQAAKAYDVLGLGGLYTKRQTFVINPDGYVVKHYEKVDAAEHSTQLLADLKALQATP